MNGKPQRREAKGFEPPPWERDAFEELSRKKAEERAEDDLEVALAGLDADEPEPPSAANEPAEDAPGQLPASAAAGPQSAQEDEVVAREARAAAMLAQLAQEEPVPKTHWVAGLVVAGLLASLGLMMLVWGIVGAARTAGVSEAGPVGLIGGVILGVFGIGLVAVASWLAARALKQRGEH